MPDFIPRMYFLAFYFIPFDPKALLPIVNAPSEQDQEGSTTFTNKCTVQSTCNGSDWLSM
jgi:hypothetical protein